ncbi:MAG TPA: hypothetical protein DD666_00880 [Advenella kashmirensis]|uniref:Uncharacterized protein n=1 Tax=Advenella kashmirensis TaxID=310575 RepID=A0A356LAK4_9BURK|nr:hypothetical protein [Advenella kashmirensis]
MVEEAAKWLFGSSAVVAAVIALLRFAQSTYMKDKENRANLGGNLSVVGNQQGLIDELTEQAERWKKDFYDERKRADEWQEKYLALAQSKGEKQSANPTLPD